jgi:aspartyl-tRNA(Asn)/glutamyl-tRNA(Gln) amidotransferase subunit B
MVIGLETHVELSTKTKIFCGCTTRFGGEPNTQCCHICTGMPGSLPVLNRSVVEYAAKAGLTLGGEVNTRSVMARKHYVYPDLTKAYQISQYDLPLVTGGGMYLANGRRIGLTRIHIEEDPGKLVYAGGEVRIDYNRSGIPLIEIVTEPDFRSKDEVLEYMERLQTALRAIGVSDCRMQEGSMRCDVNISLRRPGESAYGTRSETKNLNSFTAVAAAIEYEYDRQAEILDGGGTVTQETRAFDADTGETSASRGKEDADDYRYFPEPDIITVILPCDDIERLRGTLPEMPEDKLRRYTAELGVSEADARLLTKYRAVSEYFEKAVENVTPKLAAGFITTTMFSDVTTEAQREHWNPAVTAEHLNGLLRLLDENKINRATARRVYRQMDETGGPATAFLSDEDMGGVDGDALIEMCRAAISSNAKSVADYRAGKEKALKAIVGAVMRESKGRADAQAAEKTILRLIGGEK